MPLYEYKGLNKSGKNVKGTLDSDNSRTAKVLLKKQGIYVIDLKDKTRAAKKTKRKKTGTSGKISVKELSQLTRQLATLLKAGIPLVDALLAVSEQTDDENLSNIMAEIKNMVNEGATLHRSLAKYPKIFDKIFVSMCEAGETSGTLDTILLRLAEFTESQSELTSKVKSAMLYPAIMFIFTILILMVIFVVVVPDIVAIFEATPELTLPWYTLLVIDISGFMVDYWPFILIGMFGFGVVFRNWKNSETGRPKWDAIYLKLPLVGRLGRMIAVSRFTRTLSTLLDGGVPMLNAMGIVRNVVNNEVLGAALDNARDNISEGESIAGPLRKSGEFPSVVIHMVSVGEKTGELEKMLNQVSDSYDFQVKTEVSGLTSVLEPVMLIVMGCVIGSIVFSIMIPMFDMINLGG